MIRSVWYGMVLAAGLFVGACGGEEASVTDTGGAPASAGVAHFENIKLKDGAGNGVLELKHKDDGAKLVDGNEQELARFTLRDGELKIKGADDAVLGYVKIYPGRYKLKDATKETELFQLKPRDAGGWKLVDPDGQTLVKIEPKDYGFKLVDATEAELFKAKLSDGKASLRNPADETVYSTKDGASAEAIACLGLDQLDVPQRMALFYLIQTGAHLVGEGR